MGVADRTRKALRRIVLGDSDFPAQCTEGLTDPQAEVSVELHGAGTPRDVTHKHVLACAAPFTIGLCLDSDWERQLNGSSHLSLKFEQRCGNRRLLGEIGIRRSAAIPLGHWQLQLFEARSCKNYCLPRPRLWAQYLYHEYLRWRGNKDPDVPMTLCGAHAMIVFFICPRPVVLVSVAHGEIGNIFPMNLMGHLGNGYFAFALNSCRQAAPLVERAGKVALSSLPIEQFAVARQLGKNHRRESIDWNQLSFETNRSRALGLPVPRFALRVTEMKVEAVRRLGSHTFFVARILNEELWAEGRQCFVIHGIYKAWRQKNAEVKEDVPSTARA
jgi:flavin reductase (DIM6/NTAB) family NADH-FMN oxidoreductase RutF